MEYRIVKFLNKLGSGWISKSTDYTCRFYPFIIFWIILVSLFLIFDEVYGDYIFFGFFAALLLQVIITEGLMKGKLIKFWGVRERPYLRYPEIIKPVGEKRVDSAFPSSHLAISVLFFIVLLSYHLYLWPLAIISVAFVAYARIHNGMHYPSDILAGIILGIAYGWSGIWIIEQILR